MTGKTENRKKREIEETNSGEKKGYARLRKREKEDLLSEERESEERFLGRPTKRKMRKTENGERWKI